MTAPPGDAAREDFDVTLPSCPYPGLRPFQKSEWPVFFGRETMTDEIIAQLIARQVVVVHGDSGCGKSSLLRAGVFARLEQENARGGLTWRTCTTEPGDAPLLGLARRLSELDGHPGDEERTTEIRRVLNFGKDAPAALATMLLRGETDHICLLIDQFEELFAFVRNHGRDEAGLLVALLVGLVEKPPRGLYAVVAMRSEFLGSCAQFTGFAEAVNRTQYLVPRMGHLDLVRAIREPATLYGGRVALDLAEQLIADAGGGQDQLPLIQHGLMVLYRRKREAVGDRQGSDAPPWRLGLEDYGHVSVAQLLSEHADALCPTPGDPNARVIEWVFRALTTINADGQAIRRPQSLAELVRVTGTATEILGGLLKPFRAEGASLLRPYGEASLALSDRIDISHEALIRCWKRIADPRSGWLRLEFWDGLIWKSLRVQSRSFHDNPSNVLSPAAAKERAEWISQRSEAWAERYEGEWEPVQQLVRASVEAARAEEAAKRRRVRQLFAGISLVAVVLLALVIGLGRELQRANTETAKSLWNRLDFASEDELTDDELHALQEIGLADRGIRNAFIVEIQRNPAKLGRRPAPVLRAVYLRWPADVVSATWDSVLRASSSEKNPERLAALVAVAEAMPGRLTSQQAQVVLASWSKDVDAGSFKSGPMWVAVAGRLPPDAVGPAFETLLRALAAATEAETTRTLGAAIEAVPGTLSPEQAESAFGPLLARLATARGSDELTAIGVAIFRVAARVVPGDSRSLSPLAHALASTTDPSGLAVLAAAVRKVPGGFPADQAQSVLAAQVSLLTSRSKELGRIRAATDVVNAVPGPLTDDQARTVLDRLLKLTTSTDDEAFYVGCAAIQAVARHVTAEQASSVRRPLLKLLATTDASRLIDGDRSASRLRDLVVTLAALPGRVTAEEAHEARSHLVRELASTTDPYRMEEFAAALRAVPAPLSADQADQVIAPLIEALSRTANRDDLAALALAIQTVGDQLPAASGQSALAALLAALARTTEGDALEPLAAAVQSMPGSLTASQANAALDALVDALTRTTLPAAPGLEARPVNVFNAFQMNALSSALQAIIGKLDAKDARVAVDPLLKSLGTLTDAGQLRATLLSATAAAGKLTSEQLGVLGAAARGLLEWSPTVSLSETAAKALSAPALRGTDVVESVRTIVEYLKYPNAAGAATEVLLDTLHTIVPEAPGGSRGLDANLDWIARTYRSVDLDKPPTLPLPRTVTVQAAGSSGGL